MKKLFDMIFGSPMRNRFTLFFIVLALAPILALGATAVYFIDVSHRLDVAALETQLIDQKITEIKTFFADAQGAMDIRVAFEQTSEIAQDQQAFLLKGLLGENRAFRAVRFANLAGVVTARDARESAQAQPSAVSFPEDFGGIEDVSRLPEFTVARSGKPYVGEVRQTLDGPAITLAMPVRNRGGDIIQVLAADVSLAALFSSIDKARLGSSGYLLVFDKNGALISGHPSAPAPGSDFSRRERVGALLAGRQLLGTDAKDLYESYADTAPVLGAGKSVPGIGWAILAEWPVADADAVIDDLRVEVLELTLLSIVAVLLLAPLFVSRLTHPIRELGLAAKAVEEGKFDTSIAIKTGDELEELGDQFNTMTKGLKRLQELRNELVHIMTHELRAPTTAIKYAASMLRDGGAASSEEMRRLVEPIWVSSNHLVNLINDLLDVAASEAGKLKFTIEPVALAPLVSEVEAELRSFAGESRVELKYEPPAQAEQADDASLPPASADKMRVKQVLMNFISNGIKYNRAGGSVIVRHEVLPTEIITHVADTGIGMSEDDQKHLFEKFHRAASVDGKIEGTGLGLFIAKDLVEKMDGRVWVSSTLGAGTTFSFTLPRADVHPV